jgi:purine-binding chemotaxis protein CheW
VRSQNDLGSDAVPERAIPFLRFELSGRPLGIPGALVREVARAVAITPLPKAPPVIEGVINVRGVLVPVLDVRRRFGLSPSPLAPEQYLLVAEAGERLVALRVDQVLDVFPVDEGTIESPARIAPGTEYVAGIARLPDGLLVIHDLEAFLSLDEAARTDEALVRLPAEAP